MLNAELARSTGRAFNQIDSAVSIQQSAFSESRPYA